MSSSAVRAGRAYLEIFLKDQVSAGLRMVSQRLRGVSSVLQSVGKQMLGVGIGIATPLAIATVMFANFDDAMRSVGAVTMATQDQLASMTVVAKNLGATTSFTAVQVGQLMAELGRAGFNPKQVEEMTGAVLNLARATSTDATLASGIMAAAIRQFGLEATDATRVADVMTATANKTFNTVEQLGEALSYAGPVAKSFNMSFEDTLAVLGGLGNVGIQASNAGTALRRLLTITGADAAHLQEIFGVAFVDSAGNARPLVDVLGEVNAATANLGTAARSAKFAEAFGLLGITAAGVIGDSAADIAGLAEQLKNVDGVAAKTAAMMDAGLGGSFRILLSAVEGTAIAFGDALAPSLIAIAAKMIAGLDAVRDFINSNKGLAISFAAIAVGLIAGGGALIALGLSAQLAAFAIGGLATITGVAGTVLGIFSPGVLAVAAALWLKRAATVATTAAMSVYATAVGGSRLALVGLASVIGAVRVGVAGLRLVFVTTAAAVGLATGTFHAAQAVWAATAAGVRTFGMVMTFTGGTMRAFTAAWRATTAALGASQLVISAGIGLIHASGAAMTGLRTAWLAITGAVATARAAMTLANVHQMAFAAGARAVLAVDAAWQAVRAGMLAVQASIVAVGSVMTLANAQQLAFAAGSSVLGVARSVWASITAAVLTARAAMTLANVQQLAFAAGTAVLGVARSVWASITAAVLTTRAAMTLANVQQLAMGAGTAAIAIARGVWTALTAAVYGTGAAMSLVRGISLTTAGALAVMTVVANGGTGAMALLSTALAAVQAAALGPIAPIALIVAALAGLGALLYINRETVFDFLGNALAGLGPIIDGVSAQWSSFTAGISSWFSAVVGEAKIAWTGISAAMAVGDLEAAWTIAWNTMKIVALQTFGPLASAWNEFTTGLTSMFDGAIVGIRTAWNSAVTFIAQTMFSVLGTIQAALDRIAEFDPTGVATKLREMLNVDTDGISKMLGEDNARFAGQVEADKQKRDADRGTELAKKQADLAAAIAEAEAAIRKTRDEALLAAVRKDAEQNGKGDFGVVAGASKQGAGVEGKLDGIVGAAKAFANGDSTKKATGGDVASTASSAVAALLAAGTGGVAKVEDRIAEATEATAEHAEETKKNTAGILSNTARLGLLT